MVRTQSASPGSLVLAAILMAALAAPAGAQLAGRLDADFGDGGKVTVRVGTAVHDGSAAALLPDGRVLVAGAQFTGSPGYQIVMARFLPDGALDSSFGAGGQVSAGFAVSFRPAAIALQADGKILVAGSTDNALVFGNELFDMALARFNADGSLDTGFGSGGFVLTDVFGREDRATAVAALPDGKILLGGWATNLFGTTGQDFVLARYLPDGQLDASFGVNGIRVTDFFGSIDVLQALAVQPDGKIVAVGEVKFTPLVTPFNRFMSVGLARYEADGQLDLGFGEGGKVHTEFFDEFGDQLSASARAIALQDDGRIVITGHAVIGNQFQSRNVILARYSADGSLDTKFGDGGRVNTDLGRFDDSGASVLVLPNGKIAVAGDLAAVDGFGLVSVDRSFVVLRYHANGSADAGFGPTGAVVTDFGPSFDSGSSILRQADNKLIAAGSAAGGFGLARYLNPGGADH